MQLKIFSDYINPLDVEDQVNKWLETFEYDVKHLQTAAFQQSDGRTRVIVSVLYERPSVRR